MELWVAGQGLFVERCPWLSLALRVLLDTQSFPKPTLASLSRLPPKQLSMRPPGSVSGVSSPLTWTPSAAPVWSPCPFQLPSHDRWLTNMSAAMSLLCLEPFCHIQLFSGESPTSGHTHKPLPSPGLVPLQPAPHPPPLYPPGLLCLQTSPHLPAMCILSSCPLPAKH